MKISNLIPIVLFLFLFPASIICFSQEKSGNPDEEWLSPYGFREGPILRYRFDKYSEGDIVGIKQKISRLQNSKIADEWEGIYEDDLDEVGFHKFQWSADRGFLYFYIYTCLPELRGVNYGDVINYPDSIFLTPAATPDSLREMASVRYVKVKWGGRHYLVPDTSLLSFAEKAAGIYVEPDGLDDIRWKSHWSRYWVNGDFEKPLTGLPEYPDSYKKFARVPLMSTITSVDSRVVEKERELVPNTFVYDSAIYSVKIAGGRNKGIKEGMEFEVIKTRDIIHITEVSANTATGVLARDVNNESKIDSCLNNDGNHIPCPKLSKSLSIKTITGKLTY